MKVPGFRIRHGRRLARGIPALAVVVAALAVSAAPAFAVAPNFTWTGAGSIPDWSSSSNWTAGAPTTNQTIGTLTFPELTSPACTSASSATCYDSSNDVSGLTVGTLAIDSDGGYFIDSGPGDGITLTGGLNLTDVNQNLGSSEFDVPIALGADQTWTADYGDLFLGADITGNHTLGVTLNHTAELELGGTDNVGAVSFNGSDATLNGDQASDNGIVQLQGGELNGTSLNAVGVNHVWFQGFGDVGPLTVTGGYLDVAPFARGSSPTTLNVHGALALNSSSASAFTFYSPTSSGPYSKITAGGPVTLAGDLQLRLGFEDCPQLTVGQVFTLISTTSTLTGTFNGVPDGTEVVTQPSKACQNDATLRINYTASSVTATVTHSTPPAPQNTGNPPTITGTLTVGSTLTAQNGDWTPTPTGFSYQWYRCNAGDDVFGDSCVEIPGATAQTYQLQAADQGKIVFVFVTAHDATGDGHATSDATGVIQPGTGGGGGGGGTGTGGGGGSVVTPPTDGQILSNLIADLLPTGPNARIAKLLKNGGYALLFQALTAGNVEIDWYLVPKGAHLTTTKHKKKKVVLVARGTKSFAAAGKATITIKLTKKGRKALKGKKKVKLTAKGKFTPTGGKPVVALKPFTIKH